jgi:hypothetical protein
LFSVIQESDRGKELNEQLRDLFFFRREETESKLLTLLIESSTLLDFSNCEREEWTEIIFYVPEGPVC